MDSSDRDDFDRARFATVLQNLKRDSIPSFASAVRYSGHQSTGIIGTPTTPRPINCRLLSRITCGSFNAVFKLLFADGTLWVLKIPASGHHQCWNVPAREALASEAFTMRLIRRETTVPVPEVFAFDASLENELGCPFILMELIHGKPLHEVWFVQGVSQAIREQIRIRSLQGIAEAMTQLNALAFDQGGSLLFDPKGNVAGIGTSNVVDLEKQLANMRSTDYDNTMAFCQRGPFTNPRSYLLSLLDARQGKGERCEVEQGAHKLLRLFIEWSITDKSTEEKPFVLAHADLDNQNILVNNDGSLAGIIDWDWIGAVPRCIGCQSFPKFLTQDYDPANYAYDVDAGTPLEGYLADSPAELTYYRAIYAHFMESYLSEEDRVSMSKSRRYAAHVRKARKEAADLTRRSLVTHTLYLAAQAPSRMKRSMVHLFDQIEDITAAQWPEESSITDSGEQANSEEARKEEYTAQSEADDDDSKRKNSCTHSAGSEGKSINTEQLSADELLDEIEKLTGSSSTSNTDRDTTQTSLNSQESFIAKGVSAGLEVKIQGLSTTEHKNEDQKPKVSRVCSWFKQKLRRGADDFFMKSQKGEPNTDLDSSPSCVAKEATQIAFCWTEKKLRQIAASLHRDSEDGHGAKLGSRVEPMRTVGVDVLQRLQTKLEYLREQLHRKENNKLLTPEVIDDIIPQNEQVTSVSRELTPTEKRSVCRDFAHMMQENKICLTVGQQASVAHWIIQKLQNMDSSDENSGTMRDQARGTAESYENDAYSRHSDPGCGSGYKEGQDGGPRESMIERIGNEDIGGRESQNDKTDNAEPSDQVYIDHPSKNADTVSRERYLNEASQAATDLKEGIPMQEDFGVFDLLDVCIALARDNLDERRMQRLREGFLGLLNQTL